MQNRTSEPQFKSIVYAVIATIGFSLFSGYAVSQEASVAKSSAPAPLLQKGHPVDWWFVFKLNTAKFPGCGGEEKITCRFGGQAKDYVSGQQYVYASSESQSLVKGEGCAGDTTVDPLGATFDQVYNGAYYYVIWNDDFYNDPPIKGGSTWGHSKGMLAWNDAGEGFVLQVTTPSWPAAGSMEFPRKTDGNTLGCVKDDDVEVSQHFFSLRLTKEDLIKVLKSLQNASVITDPENRQAVYNGGPEDIKALVKLLGTRSKNISILRVTLSSGVELLSKPSDLHVPPWQMVSAQLQSVPLRVATWWQAPKIPSTSGSTAISCWGDGIGKTGPVQIATTGQWDGRIFGLEGGSAPDRNHAKIGVSTDEDSHYSIFGDMNQQGSLGERDCKSSQNGRGGLFYILKNKTLSNEIANLIKGDSDKPAAPTVPERLEAH